MNSAVPHGFLRHRRARALATLRTDHAMTLIFDNSSLNGWQLGHLMPLYRPRGLHCFDLPRQRMSAVLALLWQDRPNLVDFSGGHQGPMRSAMAGLSAHLPPALPSPPAHTWFACQSIGGRGLRGARGVLFAQRQLPLQICDLLLGIRDLRCCLAISSAWRRICGSLSDTSRRSRSFSRSRSLACWLRCHQLIHHTIADPARFVQQNRPGYLNCYVQKRELPGFRVDGKGADGVSSRVSLPIR